MLMMGNLHGKLCTWRCVTIEKDKEEKMKRRMMQGVAAMLILAGLVFAIGCGSSSSTTAAVPDPDPAPASGSTVSGNAK